MRGRPSAPALLALAGIIILAALALWASDGADATVTGKPIPPAGSDWVIDTDTTVDDESLIGLSGSILVEPGYRFRVSDSKIVFDSSSPGEHGIDVRANATASGDMVFQGVTVEAASADSGWTFVVHGDANLTSCTLDSVHDGLRILGGTVRVSDCAITATGDHGILIEGASPSITGTSIDLLTDGEGTGIEVLSTPSVTSRPLLEDLVVRVDADITVSSPSMTTNVQMELYGIRATGADVGTLRNVRILHGGTVDATTTNAGNPRMYIYIRSTGLRMDGSTSVTGLDNVDIQGEGVNVSVTYGGTRTFRLYTHDYVTGLDNAVDAGGSCPSLVQGLEIMDQVTSITIFGSAIHESNSYGSGIAWDPDPAAVSGGDLGFQGVLMHNLSVSRGFDVADGWNLTLDTCNVTECAFTEGVLVLDGWTHAVMISDCGFLTNLAGLGEGDLLFTLMMEGDLVVTENVVTGNMMGTFLTVDAPLGGVTVTLNEFTDNTHDRDLVLLTGLGILAENPLVVSGNEFVENECQTSNHAAIKVEHAKQNVTIGGNSFDNNTGDGIYFEAPYSDYATFGHPDFTFTVRQNSFVDMRGCSIVFMSFDNNNIVVTDNQATGCQMSVVKLDQAVVSYSASGSWGSMATYLQGPDSLVVRDNDLSGNPGGGLNLLMSRYDSKFVEYSGNPYASVVIRDNDISDSGSKGWALSIVGLYNKPDITDNDLDGSVEGLRMSMIDDEAKRNPFVMIFHDHVMNGRLEGKTAFFFQGISATFYNSTIINYTHAFRVDGAEVTALWSRLPAGSGYIVSGSITVYNHLEVRVRWSDAEGVDSGVPAVGASVSLTSHGGQTIEALSTDAAGRTPVTVIKVWEMIGGTFLANSPLRVAISARGEYIEHILPVEMEMTGPEAAVLMLSDRHVPTLTVSSPWSGSVLSTPDITLRGVLTEFGSGFASFGARHDGMGDDEWVSIAPTTLWTCTFTGMVEGPHQLTVRVADRAGNVNQVQFTVTVDLVHPTLTWSPAHLDGTPLPFDEASGSYYVTTSRVLIEGEYEDDRTELEYIVIRLDGRPITALGGVLGKINIRVDLHEGTNLLLIDATDLAGNRAVREHIVTLDSSAPVLYVTSPLDGARTREPIKTVTGLTEPATRLELRVESASGTRVYDHVETPHGDEPILSGEDGTFAFDIELFEGIQVLFVSAEDRAGNVRDVKVDIVLDTKPPEFDINDPEDEVTMTSETTITLVGSIHGDYNVTLIVNGQRSEWLGVFSVNVPLHEGENLIEVIAIDDVGNSRREERTVIVDTLAPVLVVTSPEGDDILTRSTSVPIAGTVKGSSAAGGTAGVFVTFKGSDHDTTLVSGTWDDGTWEFTLELGAGDLDQEITVTAWDAAGNTDMATLGVTLDVIPPSLQLDEPPQSTRAPVITLNGTTDVGIDTVWVNGIPHPVIDGLFSADCCLAPGENTLRVETMDAAGNVQTVVRTVTLEWEEPGPEPESTSEEADSGLAYAIALVVAGLAVLAIAVVMARGRERGDA